MSDIFDSQAETVVLQSYMAAKKQAEEDRKKLANERLAIYHDDWGDILEEELSGQFEPSNFRNIHLSANTTQNILKKVVNEISLVYKRVPERSPENEIYVEMEEDINSTMQLVNRYLNLLNDVLIRPIWDESAQKVRLMILTPANTSVIQNDLDPTQADGIFYELESADDPQTTETKKYVFFSRYAHFIVNGNGDAEAPSEDNEEMVNPYLDDDGRGVLPFVILHKNHRPGMFWDPTDGYDLVRGTILTGMKRTMKDYAFKHQSFKQMWLRTNAETPPHKILIDPLTAIKITGQTDDIGILDLTADFQALDNTLQGDINAFLSTYGLTVDMFAVSPKELSGRALEVMNRALQEIREMQIKIFRRAETELYKLIRIVYNYHSGKKIPEEKFSINFIEPEFTSDPGELKKQAYWDMEHGLMSPGAFYLKFNPDGANDEKDAEQTMIENMGKLRDMKSQGFSLDKLFGNTTETVNAIPE